MVSNAGEDGNGRDANQSDECDGTGRGRGCGGAGKGSESVFDGIPGQAPACGV